jgi:hypothetical protein
MMRARRNGSEQFARQLRNRRRLWRLILWIPLQDWYGGSEGALEDAELRVRR